MDLTIIRVKRALDTQPIERIGLACKRRKLDNTATLEVFGTMQSKDESLEQVLRSAVLKLKNDKAKTRHKQLQELDYKQLYKYKTHTTKAEVAADKAQSVAQQRYQIVNKSRGFADLDPETQNYLSKSGKINLIFTNKDEGQMTEANKKDGASGSDSSPAEACASSDKGSLMTGIEVLDVDHCSVAAAKLAQDDVICMNGVPLQQSYVYDIFVTRVPKEFSFEEMDITDICSDQVDADDSEGYAGDDTDDSNDENNYRNEYPEEEQSGDSEDEEACYQEKGLCSYACNSDDELVEHMQQASIGKRTTQPHFLGTAVPTHLQSMLNWSLLGKKKSSRRATGESSGDESSDSSDQHSDDSDQHSDNSHYEDED